jgi:hypothetical protein
MYYKLIPFYTARLLALKNLLQTAQKQAEEKKISEETLLNLRLIADMFPIIRQVRIVCDNAKMSVCRLA